MARSGDHVPDIFSMKSHGMFRVFPTRAWRGFLFILALTAAALLGHQARAQDIGIVPIAYLSQAVELPPKLSNLDIPPTDGGIAGGQLSITDNNTTGKFMKQEFQLSHVAVPVDGDVLAAFGKLVEDGLQLIIVDAGADVMLKMADLVKDKDVLIFNAGAADTRLRDADCRANILHIAPSRAMLAEGLAQYLIARKWRKWFLIEGRRGSDKLFADAVRHAARKFGGKIVEERKWDYSGDTRRTAQAEVPRFTQGVKYDVLVVADEIGEFGWYLEYRTFSPRPVVGTQGLTPTSWHRTHEQWGAAQLQSRFLKRFNRRMEPQDYHVWAAIRSIGEAASRTSSVEFADLRSYLFSDEFELAGFKGQKLTFRKWNNQLRQPIMLAAPKAMVSVSPQDAFLHRYTQLDTMGLDAPETSCKLR